VAAGGTKNRAGGTGAAEPLLALAREQLEQGKVAEAEATARRLAAAAPGNAEAHLLVGEALRRGGRLNDAVLSFRAALGIAPGHAMAHYLMGVALRDARRTAEAEFAFQDAAAANPGLAEAHLEIGNLALAQAQAAAAEAAYRRALAARPGFASAHYNLGNVLRESGRLDAAAAAYREAVRHKADYLEAWYNLGLAETGRGRLAAAAAAYGEAVALRPDFAEGHNNIGVALRGLGRMAEAEAAFRRALAIRDFAMPHYNLAGILDQRGQRAEAAAEYRQAAALEPGFPAPEIDLAGLLVRQGEAAQGEQLYRQLLAKHPVKRDVQLACLEQLAKLLRDLGRTTEAVPLYRQLLQLDAEHAEALAALCQIKAYACDWRGRDAEFARLMAVTKRQLAAGARTALAGFDALARPLSPAQHLAIARSWAADTRRQMAPWRAELDFRFERGRRHERLRIGYVSQDFRNHALAHLTQSLYGLHDRAQFEVFGYAVCRDDGSDYRRAIERGCEHFADIHALSDVEAAQRIAGDEIDILVDVMGYTTGMRMGIVALRPAPVVVSFLQYPGTSGADFIDYLLTDRVVTTPADQELYAEKLVSLPNCYQPNDWRQPIDPAPVTRADCGLPDDAFVFCCFNNSYKIEPFIFDLWMRLLQRLPQSVLWLLRVNPAMERHLKREAAARGIPADRLVFAEKTSKAKHLARQALGDLFLDTRYYTAHTTASDALWGGLPVLTCPGETFASRVSASILQAAGLPELIVPDFDEYERRAAHLAAHPAELRAIRERWAAQRSTCALFDTRRYVRNLERAYRMIWDDYRAGIPPRPLSVTED
jgi:predicted O-linked N-acetylglucosamine transferase (SPINDLY family)